MHGSVLLHIVLITAIYRYEGRGGWLDYWAFSGGALADDASHVMDLARMVLGDPGTSKISLCMGWKLAMGITKGNPEFHLNNI